MAMLMLRIFALALVTLSACGDIDRTHPIEEVRADRRPEIPRGLELTDAQRLGLERRARSAPPALPKFAWKLPEGWKELPPAQFRNVNFTLERNSELECYLSVVSGGLAANVNRWRGQMGLAPLAQAELEKLPQKSLLQNPALFVELEGDFRGMGGDPKKDYGLLGLLFPIGGENVVTLKLVGPAALVAEERERFFELAETLRVDRSEGLSWSAPPGWEETTPRGSRIVTFHPPGTRRPSATCTGSRATAAGSCRTSTAGSGRWAMKRSPRTRLRRCRA